MRTGLGTMILAAPGYDSWFGGGGNYGNGVDFDPYQGWMLPTRQELLDRRDRNNQEGGLPGQATFESPEPQPYSSPSYSNALATPESPAADSPGAQSPPIIAVVGQGNSQPLVTAALIIGGVVVLKKLIGG